MKKIIPILTLLLAAAFVFIGCDKDGNQLVPDEFTPLFDPDDLDVDFSKLELSDGKWIYREIALIDNKISIEQLEFTVKNNVIDKTKDYTFKIGKLTRPKGSSEVALATFIAKGLADSDNNYTLNTITKKDYEAEDAKSPIKDSKETTDYYLAYLTIERFSKDFIPLGYKKTNQKKTKFFYTASEYEGTNTKLQNYLEKDD